MPALAASFGEAPGVAPLDVLGLPLGHQPLALGAGTLGVEFVAGPVDEDGTWRVLALGSGGLFGALARGFEGAGAAADAVVADAVDGGSDVVVVEDDLATGAGPSGADFVAGVFLGEVEAAPFAGDGGAGGGVEEHVAGFAGASGVGSVAVAVGVLHVAGFADALGVGGGQVGRGRYEVVAGEAWAEFAWNCNGG